MGTSVPALLGEGLCSIAVEVPKKDVVLVRAFLEAREGLGVVFAESGGALILAAPTERRAELLAFIDDLREEMTVVMVSEQGLRLRVNVADVSVRGSDERRYAFAPGP
jgi:hypothetical protein